MPRRRISSLFTVFVAFVVLMGSNAWLKSIFGYGEIANDIPFLLAGVILFLAWRFNRRAANQRSDLLGSRRSWRSIMPHPTTMATLKLSALRRTSAFHQTRSFSIRSRLAYAKLTFVS